MLLDKLGLSAASLIYVCGETEYQILSIFKGNCTELLANFGFNYSKNSKDGLAPLVWFLQLCLGCSEQLRIAQNY